MSLIGAGATIAAALIFFPSGHFFAGTIWVLVFVLFDLLDGTIARLSNKGSNAFGALLDSTLDRLSDSASRIQIQNFHPNSRSVLQKLSK